MIDCLLAIYLFWSSVWNWCLQISPTFLLPFYQLVYSRSIKIVYFQETTLSLWCFERQMTRSSMTSLDFSELFDLLSVYLINFDIFWLAIFKYFLLSFWELKKRAYFSDFVVICNETETHLFKKSAWHIYFNLAIITCFSYWPDILGYTIWPCQFTKTRICQSSTVWVFGVIWRSVFLMRVILVRDVSTISYRLL